MSDSNIYMALAQSDCFPWSDRWESERKQEERVEAGGERDRGRLLLQRGGWSISDAICPPRYFRIRWSPSPSSSGWERGGTLHSCRAKSDGRTLCGGRYELTFDSADQKTALVGQVVNHLETTKQNVKCAFHQM